MRDTYFIELNFGGKLGRCYAETPVGFNESDVIDTICSGQYDGAIRNIYLCGLGKKTEEVTDEIAKKILKISETSDIGRTAIEWLDWCGYGAEEAAE